MSAPAPCTPAYGEVFLDRLHRCLEQEESELRTFTPDPGNRWLWSISYCYEPWIQYLFVRHAARNADGPRLWVEDQRIDVCYVSNEDKHLARFELKAPVNVNRHLPEATLRPYTIDLRKQADRAASEPHVDHYVAYLPFGSEQNVEAWISHRLETAPVPVQQVGTSRLIKLNRDGGEVLAVVVMKVGWKSL